MDIGFWHKKFLQIQAIVQFSKKWGAFTVTVLILRIKKVPQLRKNVLENSSKFAQQPRGSFRVRGRGNAGYVRVYEAIRDDRTVYALFWVVKITFLFHRIMRTLHKHILYLHFYFVTRTVWFVWLTYWHSMERKLFPFINYYSRKK